VVNPNTVDIDVRATFDTEEGHGVSVTVPVAAGTRTNIWPAVTGNAALDPAFALLQGRRFSVFLESVGDAPLPFVAERAMYWNNFAGGHANAGTPWSGSIAAPAHTPADVTITRMTPASGRLSGGTVVAIEGRGFGATADVFLGGQRVVPTAVSPTSITFVTPARSAASGYGTAGPVTVAVRTNGRFIPTTPFTRGLSVLAFGDSLTYGTSNVVVGGLKVPVSIARPYPLGLRTLLRQQAQFGQYALVTNAGWPGEQVTRGDAVTPGGELRFQACTSGLANCLHPHTPNPNDYVAPHDLVVVLEGVNDLIDGAQPERIRDALRRMTLQSRAQGSQVLLTRFDSVGIDERTGTYAVDPALNEALGTLVFGLAVEQATLRERFTAIEICPDGLHPTQIGYDRMAEIVFRKVRDAFPRCPAGQGTCP
jgi:lysophospholipase L1-like esterase